MVLKKSERAKMAMNQVNSLVGKINEAQARPKVRSGYGSSHGAGRAGDTLRVQGSEHLQQIADKRQAVVGFSVLLALSDNEYKTLDAELSTGLSTISCGLS